MRKIAAFSLAALSVLLVGLVVFRQTHRPPMEDVVIAAAPEQHSSQKPRSVSTPSKKPEEPLKPQNRNSIARYVHGEEAPKLTDAQLAPFLAANHRNAGSLLAAFRTSGDPKYLREAMQNFSKDARVDYAASCSAYLTPDERRQAMEDLKQSDPNNALGNYLSAADYFKSGQQQQALDEMTAAAKKPGWQDYTADFVQNAEEAYSAAGYSEVESKYLATANALLPDLDPIKSVGVNMTDLAKTYQQSGDTASAEGLFQSTINLGQQIGASQDQPIITTLVGIAIEKMAFNAMDPNAAYGDPGQTVQDQLNALNQERTAIKQLVNQGQPLIDELNDQDVLNYLDREAKFGELPTLQWAVNKYGQQ